jgi:hypothetical protein
MDEEGRAGLGHDTNVRDTPARPPGAEDLIPDSPRCLAGLGGSTLPAPFRMLSVSMDAAPRYAERQAQPWMRITSSQSA